MQSNESVMASNRNFFSLNRLHADCYYPPIRVDFNSNPTLKTSNNSILPVYNHDSHFFTPTFLLPSEKTYFSNNCSSQRLKFAEKVNAELGRSGHEQSRAGELGLLSSESKYCQICQMKFEDYWRHVAEKSHERKMHLSQSNLHIRDLCQAFNANTPKGTQGGPNSEAEPRRGRKPKNNQKGLERCISEEMLKAVQGNCSTQILLGNEQQGL